GNPGSHLERLNVLSKNVSDAINEIFSMAYAQTQELSWTPPSGSDPDIRLVEKSLWINRIMIPLASRQKTLHLIQAFFQKETMVLSKFEIVEAVYGPQSHHSQRFIDAQDGNLTKLLSRTRTFLEKSLAHTYPQRPLDWLVFDIKARKYLLYKVRTDFIKL
ncbi:MAG TPA: hypothetical protein VE954_13000, partial [Oligoflexus sp.]|uniref:hypothetical protein n=1 Tax=Oligoflexus sp. TaxID=1971216 RepID=UPI002D6615F7